MAKLPFYNWTPEEIDKAIKTEFTPRNVDYCALHVDDERIVKLLAKADWSKFDTASKFIVRCTVALGWDLPQASTTQMRYIKNGNKRTIIDRKLSLLGFKQEVF